MSSVDFLVKVRDGAQQIADACNEQLEKMAPPETEPKVTVKEETFTNLLGWEKSQGTRLGEFEFTSRKANNNSDSFNHAYNILKANNAAINNRLHGEGFQFGYWLYEQKPDVIYRQILKTK